MLNAASGVSAQDIWAAPTSSSQGSQAAPVSSADSQAAHAPTEPVPVSGQARTAGGFEADGAVRYAERVLAGLRQIVLRDFEGALVTLRAAAQLEPASPAAFCHLGDAQLGKENWVEARAAYEGCARFAALANDVRYATLAAVGNARATELSQASLSERRDAYLRLSAATNDGAAKAMAAGRLGVLEALLVAEPDHTDVRKRIADRAAKAAK